jgi:hypothetical protein
MVRGLTERPVDAHRIPDRLRPVRRAAPESARVREVQLTVVKAGAEGEFEAAFATLVQQQVGAPANVLIGSI